MRKTANALLLVAVGALTLSSLAIVPAAADDSRVVVVSRPVDIPQVTIKA